MTEKSPRFASRRSVPPDRRLERRSRRQASQSPRASRSRSEPLHLIAPERIQAIQPPSRLRTSGQQQLCWHPRAQLSIGRCDEFALLTQG